MKLLIYKHSSLKTPIDDDILKIVLYFNSDFVHQYINEKIEMFIENTSKDYKDDTLFKPNEGIYDTVMLVYEQGTFPIYAYSYPYSPKLRVAYVSVNKIEDDIDYTWKSMCHELLHTLCFKIMSDKGVFIPNILDTYIQNENPYAPNGNFAQQLKALQPYYQTGYVYFKPSEVVGLKENFVRFLDKARGYAGVPFKITSGYRTPEHNTEVSGVDGSSHTTGLAVDLLVIDSLRGGKILKGLMKALLEDNLPIRLGFYNDNHIHCDIDSSKTNPCYWIK